MEEVITMEKPIKTFHEAHEEIEAESMLLTKQHDVKDYKSKADFLTGIGFANSIATRLPSIK